MKEIGDQRVYTPYIPELWNYITSDENEKKTIRNNNMGVSNDENKEGKTGTETGN